MKTALLLLIAAVGSLHALPSDPHCAWGESYWCSSLRAAKTCGAVDHCTSTVWRNQILAQDGSEMCQFCELIVGDVQNYIKEKKTQEEISRFLVSACGIIPKLSVAAECKAIAVEMIGDLMQLISSGVDPQVVCALLGVCGGLEDRVNHAPISPALPPINDNRISPPTTPSAEPICTDCKKFFNDIKTMITSNDTLAQVEQMIDQTICSFLGPLENPCKTTVHEFLPQLLQILSSYYDPNLICSSLGVCGAAKPDVAKVLLGALSQKFPLDASVRMGSPTTCMICKTIVTELQVLDRDKAVQDEVLGVIKTQGCARLPSQYTASCNNAVDLYGPMLFQLLASELDPDSRCAALGFCNAEVQLLPIPVSPLLPLSPAAAPPKKQNVADGPECALCEMVVKELESMLSTNASQQEIVAALEKVCNIFPDTVKVACKSFIEIYGPAVIQMVLAEMDPAQICTQLGLCTAVQRAGAAAVAPLPVKPSAPRLPLKAGNAETCLLCETVIQYLEALVQNNATVEEIEAVLEKICGFLPSTMKDECDALIEQYGALIIQYVMNLESPEQICTLIGLCSSSKSSPVPSVPMALLQPAKRVDKPSPSGVQGEAPEVKQKVPLLGENECSWGPAYWCASRENADSCNAVEHCKKFVWKQ